jgi:predicted glycosyltransferase
VLLSQNKQKINPDQTETVKFPDRSDLQGRKPRILVAPLDWGLGHATRCIPIIKELLEQGTDVWLAGEGAQEQLLRLEFPGLPFLPLPGYRVKFAASRTGVIRKIMAQSPKFLRAIRQEHQWLKKTVKENNIDAVISDNRYGLYHTAIPCVFITHQLLIKSPWGKWSERLLQNRNYKYINHFTECWVPDMPGDNTLAGDLSHPARMPAVPVKYIGWLSRLKKKTSQTKTGHLLIILSGPEPQRSIFENIIINNIARYEGSATIVRGLPGNNTLMPSTNSIRIYNHLPAEQLNEEMQIAEFVISRSGYSTVMDIAALQKKSILVPTPGQTEQEYLAGYYMEKDFACAASQQFFSLPAEVQKARLYSYQLPPVSSGAVLKTTIEVLLSKLR